MREKKGTAALLIVALALLLVSLSVAIPILVRPFYYVQIDAFQLPEQTGWSKETIRAAYDQVLDFCIQGGDFGTGALGWSEEGYRHFKDVQGLFRLNLVVLALSAAATVVLLIRARPQGLYRFGGRGPGFWAGAGTAATFILVGGLAALNFDRAFTIFHRIFFPGKDNWVFDPVTDQIILIMPQAFFRNCAILIIAVLLCGCAGLIVGDLRAGRSKRI